MEMETGEASLSVCTKIGWEYVMETTPKRKHYKINVLGLAKTPASTLFLDYIQKIKEKD
jgi:hypothetical protein